MYGAIKLLLDNGANANQATTDYCVTPLYVAAKNGHDGVVELLLDNGANVNQTNIGGWSPLLCAARNGHNAAINLLLNCGADVNAMSHYGDTALVVALQEEKVHVFAILMAAGAQVYKKMFDECQTQESAMKIAMLDFARESFGIENYTHKKLKKMPKVKSILKVIRKKEPCDSVLLSQFIDARLELESKRWFLDGNDCLLYTSPSPRDRG